MRVAEFTTEKEVYVETAALGSSDLRFLPGMAAIVAFVPGRCLHDDALPNGFARPSV